MKRAKRIFAIADFKDERLWSVFVEERRIVKALIRRGCDVHRFSYKNVMMQCGLFSGKSLSQRFSRKKTDKILLDQIKHYYPDIIFLLGMKYFDADTISHVRDIAPKAIFIGRDGDPFPEKNPDRLAIGKLMDIVVMPSAGSFLQTYKDLGVSCCSFIPFSCDPDIQYRYEPDNKWITDIIFTGKAEHKKLDRDQLRYELALRLSKMPNAKLYGCLGRPKTDGLDCFRALSSAKIGLSVNIANDVQLYHSDRYINIPAGGTFTLAKRVPGYELLFKDGIHMKYFDSADEFFDLADWYLKHDDERKKIADAGMEQAHKEFNFEKIAQYTLDLIENGTYSAPWTD